MSHRQWAGVVIVIGLIGLEGGCGRSGRASLSATIPGRKVYADVEAPAIIRSNRVGAYIEFGDGHKIAVEKTVVGLDGKVPVHIEAEVKEVEVTSSGGKFTVKADGKEVYRSPP